MAAAVVDSAPAPPGGTGKPENGIGELEIFKFVKEQNVEGVRLYLQVNNAVPDVYDNEGMTPLQHAAFSGNVEICQLLVDQGADVNKTKHPHKYTTLHFAALSGKLDVIRLLLSHGADPDATNSVGKTPGQIGAFVGNHDAVSLINNYVAPTVLDRQFRANRVPSEVSAVLATPLHSFVTSVNVHPVKLLMFLEKHPVILDQAKVVTKVLESARDYEMRPQNGDANEVISFKFHYLLHFVEFINQASKNEERAKVIAKLTKKFLLGVDPDGTQEFMEKYLREVIRHFPFIQSALFQNMVSTLSKTPIGGHPSAYSLVNMSINGQRMFQDEGACYTCGSEKATKKCSKCKSVQYCDQECQKLHWFTHKKFCDKYNEERLQAEKDHEIKPIESK